MLTKVRFWGAKRTCLLPTFGDAFDLLVPGNWELLEETLKIESGRLSAFENDLDDGR
jgi:hypothetical protein